MALVETIYKKISRVLPKSEKESSAVGLDIGNFSVKLVKSDIHNSKRTISALACEDIKGSNVGDAIKRAIDKTAIGEKNVNIGLSGKQIILRCIVLPEMDNNTFKSSMKYEAAKHIPFSIDEVVLDYSILKHKINTNKMLVLIAAAKKNYITERLRLISDLGIEAGVLDIDSLAVINIFNLIRDRSGQNNSQSSHKEKQGSGISVLLNIGSNISNLALLDGDLLRFSRDIFFGGKDISAKISSKLKVNFSEAEKIKLSTDGNPDARFAIEASLAELVNDLRLSFDYYESQTGKTVNHVYLSGGGSCLNKIDEFMNSAMNIDFEVWDPFDGFEISQSVDKNMAKEFNQRFAVAAGLSLR